MYSRGIFVPPISHIIGSNYIGVILPITQQVAK